MRIDLMLTFVLAIGCARHELSSHDLVFLTRGDCVNTETMRVNLDTALRSLKLPTDYAFIDLDTLPEIDVRRGYPTPTVLHQNADIFEMPAPTPPLPAPT